MEYEKNNLLVVIPIKELSNVKSRLSKVLSLEDRITLTNFLICELIAKLLKIKNKSKSIKIDIAIVTRNSIIESFVKKNKIKINDDTGTKSLSGAINLASKWALKMKFNSLCILLGDLANPSIKDINNFLNNPFITNEIRLCPSNDFGTNALLISPPNAIKFSYGRKSFFKHYINAIKSKLKISILKFESLRNDIDNPNNLNEFIFEGKLKNFRENEHKNFWGIDAFKNHYICFK